jgi:regulator of protease activity HflC (stomatin/prohibitin superfamily)
VSWLGHLAEFLLDVIWNYIKGHPIAMALIVLAILRLFGTTVQTGWKGVLFRFGRIRKELEPGFHPLIPIVHRVRKVQVRSATLHLAKQRITTADGLVYDVQANLVYHVADPKAALVEIVDVRQGIDAALTLIVQDLLQTKQRAELVERKGFDEEFAARAKVRLERWGVAVEQAGFVSIAPTAKTLRLTQLRQLVTERHGILERYLAEGLSALIAAALLGTDRQPLGHSAARYRKRGREVALRRRALQADQRRHLAELEKLRTLPELPVAQQQKPGQPDGSPQLLMRGNNGLTLPSSRIARTRKSSV